MRPSAAMVLAAGFGKRLRPITERMPKPLVPVAGKPMIDWALDHLAAAGVARAVVNLHYKGGMIRDHLAARARPAIAFSEEPEILETGGGIRNALPLLGADPFLAVNADILWTDGARPALDRLADAWTEEIDALLLLTPRETALGYDGPGDFLLDGAEGVPLRRGAAETAPYVFAGVQMLHPRLFDGAPGGAWSLNRLYDDALARGTLRAVVHDGGWYHVGTPEALIRVSAEVEAALAG